MYQTSDWREARSKRDGRETTGRTAKNETTNKQTPKPACGGRAEGEGGRKARASLLQPLGLGLPLRLGLLLRAARRGHRFVRGAERAAGFVQLDLRGHVTRMNAKHPSRAKRAQQHRRYRSGRAAQSAASIAATAGLPECGTLRGARSPLQPAGPMGSSLQVARRALNPNVRLCGAMRHVACCEGTCNIWTTAWCCSAFICWMRPTASSTRLCNSQQAPMQHTED